MDDIKLSCSLCEESYLVEEYDRHLSTETHLHYAKLESTYFCEICRSPASGQIPFMHHIQGKQHEKAKNKLMTSPFYPSSERINTPNYSEIPKVVQTKDGPYYLCECFTKCNTLIDLERHKEGPNCRKKMQKIRGWYQSRQVGSLEEMNR